MGAGSIDDSDRIVLIDESSADGFRSALQAPDPNLVPTIEDLRTHIGVPKTLESFNAVGDGIIDDSVAIQSALDSGEPVIRGIPGKTYLVSAAAGTKTVNSASQSFCLELPSNVLFDLNGSTIKLADSQNASIVINENAGTSQDSDLAIINGTLDGNQANQTTPGAGNMPSLFLYDCLRPRVEDLVCVNVREYAALFWDIDQGYFDHLRCKDSDGDGFIFGTTGAVELRMFRSFVDNIYVEGCLGTFGSLNGNSTIITAVQSSFGKIIGKDSAGGIKVQNSSADLDIDSLKFIGQVNGSANSGVKIQGTNASSVWPTNINIGKITCENCYGNGLFVSEIHSVSISSYVGRNNGTGGGTGSEEYDVNVDQSDGDGPNSLQIGSIYSEANGDTIAVRVIGDAGITDIDSVVLYNTIDVGVQIGTAGRCTIKSIKHIDDEGTPTATEILKIDSDQHHHIGVVETNLAHSTSQRRVIINGIYYKPIIDKIVLGSTDPLGQIQGLDADTSTAVTCGHTWREYVGGASDYFHPIIEIIPMDSTARALGSMNPIVTDGSSGTGFSIEHATAASGDDVFWRVVGWKVMSKPGA